MAWHWRSVSSCGLVAWLLLTDARPWVEPIATARAAPTHVDAGRRGSRAKKHSKQRLGKRGRNKRRVRYAPPSLPMRMHVLSTDQQEGLVHVQLEGLHRPPTTQLFVLTDKRGRRFVPANVTCEPLHKPPGPPTKQTDAPLLLAPWHCELLVAEIYRQAPLVEVSMEWGSRILIALPHPTGKSLATRDPVPPAPARVSPEERTASENTPPGPLPPTGRTDGRAGSADESPEEPDGVEEQEP